MTENKLPLKEPESVFQNVNQSPRHTQEMKKSSCFVADSGNGVNQGRRGSGAGSVAGSGTSTPENGSPRRPRKGPMKSFFNTVDCAGDDTFKYPSERGEGFGRKNVFDESDWSPRRTPRTKNTVDYSVDDTFKYPSERGEGFGRKNVFDESDWSPRHTPRTKQSMGMFNTVEGGGNSLQFSCEKPKTTDSPKKPADEDSTDSSSQQATADADSAVADNDTKDTDAAPADTLGVEQPQGRTSSPMFEAIDRSTRNTSSPNMLSQEHPENGVGGPAAESKPKKEYVDWVMYKYFKLMLNGPNS